MGINPRNLQIRPGHGLVAGFFATSISCAGVFFGGIITTALDTHVLTAIFHRGLRNYFLFRVTSTFSILFLDFYFSLDLYFPFLFGHWTFILFRFALIFLNLFKFVLFKFVLTCF